MFAFRRLLLALVLLLAAAAAHADPALWVARKGDSTVYLFGTVHMLRPDTHWRSAALSRAFGSAQELWLEIADPADAATALPLIQQLGTDPAHPLSTKLTPDELKQVDAAARMLGAPGGAAALEPLRPWAASMMLETAPLLAAGFDPTSGVDVQLKADADQAGKTVRGLETTEQQLHFLANLPAKQEHELLDSVLDDVKAGPAKLNQMVDAWAAGDVPAMTTLVMADVRQYGDIYDLLFVNRNVAWAKRLAAEMQQPGVSFVAVGAGHLLGPDSLLVQLQRRGVTVTRQ
jgi:uncharacterized protein